MLPITWRERAAAVLGALVLGAYALTVFVGIYLDAEGRERQRAERACAYLSGQHFSECLDARGF